MRKVLVAAFVIVVAFGVILLREAIMTTEPDEPPGVETEIVVHAVTRNPVPPHSAEDMVNALFLRCQLEVRTLPAGFENIGDGRFRLLVSPGLSEHDERQIEGCLQDSQIARLRAEVESITTR